MGRPAGQSQRCSSRLPLGDGRGEIMGEQEVGPPEKSMHRRQQVSPVSPRGERGPPWESPAPQEVSVQSPITP